MKTMKLITAALAAVVSIIALTACNGQDDAQIPPPDGKAGTALVDTPEVEVRVNKQYDEHGNVIAYDSSYSAIFRGHGGDLHFLDSIFQDFKPRFGTRYPFLNDPVFDDLFFQDSLFQHDFFHDDFFRKRMELNDRYMQRMMAEMDSLKNAFFRDPSALDATPPAGP